ncbi:MAG: polysulfide reductase NrfD [Saprospiraceae bacterium]|nr:polysulfide reductase NrfD [Candidatus Opimibacter iunctus]
MKISTSGSEMLRTFSPQIEHTSKGEKMWITVLVATIGLALYGLYLQIFKGHGVTGMRDNVIWGIYIVNFMFLIGLSYAGAIIAGFLILFKVEWGKPLIRLAQLMTLASVIVGPIFILLCVGRFDRLHHLFIYPRLQSPLTWDVLAVITFLVGSFLFLYLSLIQDFAVYRDSNLNVSKWKHNLWAWLALRYTGTENQKRLINTSRNLMAIVLIPVSIMVASILSWIFGMTLRPGWHSTIFGPYFVVGAIYSGIGVLIIITWYTRKMYHLERYITPKHFDYLAYMMLVMAAGYGYFTFSEYFTSWYGSETWDAQLIDKLFAPDEYGWLTFFANVAGVVIPVIFAAVPKLRKPDNLMVVAAIMVLAMWVKRYLIVVPTLETPLLPIEDIRPEYVHYTITWVEWLLTFGGVASFFLIFTLAGKFVTLIDISDLPKDENVKTQNQ